LNDLRDIASATGAVTDGPFTCGEEIVGTNGLTPIVCSGVTGDVIATVIGDIIITTFETLTPLVSNCRNVEVVAETDCSATIAASDVDNGSTGFGVSVEIDKATFGLGEHQVTLTATDLRGQTENCVATVSVVDKLLVPREVNCGIDNWRVSTCEVSSNPLSITATVTKENGCEASITSISPAHCERCNAANKVIEPDCIGFLVDGPTVTVTDPSGIGNFMRWSVTASGVDPANSVTVYCGICVEQPEGGCSGNAGGQGTEYQCPSKKPSITVDAEGATATWPRFPLATLNNCPY